MKKNILSIIVGAVAISTVLAGCGSSSGSNAMKAEAVSDYYSDDYSYAETAEEAYYEDDIYDNSSAKLESADVEDISDDEIVAKNRKLIKTVNMSIETKEFDKLVSNIEEKITSLGGYASSININGNSYSSTVGRYASIVARIPAGKLDSFVNSVEDQSNITSKDENTEDVTLSYADMEARKKSLTIEQDRLYDLLAQAESLETIIALEERLTEVRYEIESYESRLRVMSDQIDYSTVYLNISEVKEYQPEPVEELTFGERLAYEFTASCASAWSTIQDFVIGFIAFLPVLVVLVVILGVIALIIFAIVKLVILIVKKSSNKSKTKRAKKAQQNQNVKVAVALETKPEIEQVKEESDKNAE